MNLQENMTAHQNSRKSCYFTKKREGNSANVVENTKKTWKSKIEQKTQSCVKNQQIC